MEAAADNTAKLARIDMLTDAALAELDVQDLLNELLDRVCDMLAADTAAVLLLDRSSGELVATAAKGVEEEVRRGVRIPLDRGFAGVVAARREPIQLDEVSESTVLNPILWRKGLRALLGVPLISFGDLIGVLHVGTLAPRRFNQDEVQLLQLVADRVALATQARISRLDRATAVALQRSLLPTRLPSPPGLELAARYLPGEHPGVGGDWYDAFPLDSGHLGLVIGDVVGHGLSAAVIMGRLRSALRAYALETTDPAEVVSRLDHKIQHFEPGITATVLYAVVDPSCATLSLTVAGHPPPLLIDTGGPARPLRGPVDLPLGVTTDVARRAQTVEFAVGSLLCLYTDGLVERRGQRFADGLGRLCGCVTADEPARVCADVLAGMLDGDAHDDIALLAVRRTTPPGAR